MVKYLQEQDTIYGFLDQPEGIRYIISIKELHLGYIQVFTADRCNLATELGSVLFGYQDTVMTIINRARTRDRRLDPPVDMNPLVCP
jgi:hypothetical protein